MVLIFVGTMSTATAQGEHSRRAAAELQVIVADVRRLGELVANNESTLHQQGLFKRIEGGLSPLAILFRLSDLERGLPAKSYLEEINLARELLNADDLTSLQAHLNSLEAQFNLPVPAFTLSKDALENATALHRQHCAACHDNPATEVERPAYNLYEQAKRESSKAFFARMLVGVRGDRITGIDNPLSDFQIVALIQLYRSQP